MPVRGHSWDYWQKKLMDEQGYDEETANKVIGSWEKEESTEADPCWDGYEQIGMKDKDGKQVPNCVPKNKKSENFDPKELEMGKKIELEHTDDEYEAEKIAKDHLKEISDYYTKLAKYVEDGRDVIEFEGETYISLNENEDVYEDDLELEGKVYGKATDLSTNARPEEENSLSTKESKSNEHYDKNGTFWFTTDDGRRVGIKKGQSLDDALADVGIPDDGKDDSDVTGADLAKKEKEELKSKGEDPSQVDEPKQETPKNGEDYWNSLSDAQKENILLRVGGSNIPNNTKFSDLDSGIQDIITRRSQNDPDYLDSNNLVSRKSLKIEDEPEEETPEDDDGGYRYKGNDVTVADMIVDSPSEIRRKIKDMTPSEILDFTDDVDREMLTMYKQNDNGRYTDTINYMKKNRNELGKNLAKKMKEDIASQANQETPEESPDKSLDEQPSQQTSNISTLDDVFSQSESDIENLQTNLKSVPEEQRTQLRSDIDNKLKDMYSNYKNLSYDDVDDLKLLENSNFELQMAGVPKGEVEGNQYPKKQFNMGDKQVSSSHPNLNDSIMQKVFNELDRLDGSSSNGKSGKVAFDGFLDREHGRVPTTDSNPNMIGYHRENERTRSGQAMTILNYLDRNPNKGFDPYSTLPDYYYTDDPKMNDQTPQDFERTLGLLRSMGVVNSAGKLTNRAKAGYKAPNPYTKKFEKAWDNYNKLSDEDKEEFLWAFNSTKDQEGNIRDTNMSKDEFLNDVYSKSYLNDAMSKKNWRKERQEFYPQYQSDYDYYQKTKTPEGQQQYREERQNKMKDALNQGDHIEAWNNAGSRNALNYLSSGIRDAEDLIARRDGFRMVMKKWDELTPNQKTKIKKNIQNLTPEEQEKMFSEDIYGESYAKEGFIQDVGLRKESLGNYDKQSLIDIWKDANAYYQNPDNTWTDEDAEFYTALGDLLLQKQNESFANEEGMASVSGPPAGTEPTVIEDDEALADTRVGGNLGKELGDTQVESHDPIMLNENYLQYENVLYRPVYAGESIDLNDDSILIFENKYYTSEGTGNCPMCKGAGKVTVERLGLKDCPKCDGSGDIQPEPQPPMQEPPMQEPEETQDSKIEPEQDNIIDNNKPQMNDEDEDLSMFQAEQPQMQQNPFGESKATESKSKAVEIAVNENGLCKYCDAGNHKGHHMRTGDQECVYKNCKCDWKDSKYSSESCGCKSKAMEASISGYKQFINKEIQVLKKRAKANEAVGIMYGLPSISKQGRKIKGTLAYAGVSLNDRIYLPEELAKGHGKTLPLLLNHSSVAGAEEELDRLDDEMLHSLENEIDYQVGEVTLTWVPEELTLYYEGVVDNEFFQKEIDDMGMAVSLGIYYDSDSPKVCDEQCYTLIKGAEFREVSLVYHAGFPIATIEAVEAELKRKSRLSIAKEETNKILLDGSIDTSPSDNNYIPPPTELDTESIAEEEEDELPHGGSVDVEEKPTGEPLTVDINEDKPITVEAFYSPNSFSIRGVSGMTISNSNGVERYSFDPTQNYSTNTIHFNVIGEGATIFGEQLQPKMTTSDGVTKEIESKPDIKFQDSDEDILKKN